MYLSIGSDFSVRDSSILGIFDLDNTSTSKRTRSFLDRAEALGQVVPCDDLPKTFVLTAEYGLTQVHLTALSTNTLEKRLSRRMPKAFPSWEGGRYDTPAGGSLPLRGRWTGLRPGRMRVPYPLPGEGVRAKGPDGCGAVGCQTWYRLSPTESPALCVFRGCRRSGGCGGDT